MSPDFISDIRSGPHWRLLIRPESYESQMIESRRRCRELVEAAKVRLGGWDFPVVSWSAADQGTGNDYVDSWVEGWGKEYWRFYQSGQFLYLSTIREHADRHWRSEIETRAKQGIHILPDSFNWDVVPGFVEIVNLVYRVTEYFEFAARLVQQGAYHERITIRIGLNSINRFVLATHDPRRFWPQYFASSVEKLENEWRVTPDVLINDSAEPARDAIVWFFEGFGWDDANIEQIKKDQHAYLRR